MDKNVSNSPEILRPTLDNFTPGTLKLSKNAGFRLTNEINAEIATYRSYNISRDA
jgi:hypothetical protein